MTPESKRPAQFIFGLALGIGSGWLIGKEYIRRQQKTLEAKKPNVPWKKAK